MADELQMPDVLELTGCCHQESQDLAHGCMLVRYVPDHYHPLHSYVVCENVVMPINGYYFCHLDCLRTYNAHVANLGAVTVMPDDGPGDQPHDMFFLPERRRPKEEALVEDKDVVEDEALIAAVVAFQNGISVVF